MRVLIVYAHPEPTSFTAALKDTAVRALSAAGHRIEVSDLYGEGFNPVAGRHDFKHAADPGRFHYQSEQLNASRTGGFADELVREQGRLLRADLLVFVFPLWWGGLPAIVKGWFDRVCAYGVAYADGRRLGDGRCVLAGRAHRRNKISHVVECALSAVAGEPAIDIVLRQSRQLAPTADL